MSCCTFVFLCGGKGTRFRETSAAPKPLTTVMMRPMYEWVIDSILASLCIHPDRVSFAIACNSDAEGRSIGVEVARYLDSKVHRVHHVTLPYETRGAAESALLAVERLLDANATTLAPGPIWVIDNDAIYSPATRWTCFDECDVEKGQWADAAVLLAELVEAGDSSDAASPYSHVILDGQTGLAVDIAEKIRISDHCVLGGYGFKDAETLLNSTRKLLRSGSYVTYAKEAYMSCAIGSMIREGQRVRGLVTKDTHAIGTPDQVAQAVRAGAFGSVFAHSTEAVVAAVRSSVVRLTDRQILQNKAILNMFAGHGVSESISTTKNEWIPIHARVHVSPDGTRCRKKVQDPHELRSFWEHTRASAHISEFAAVRDLFPECIDIDETAQTVTLATVEGAIGLNKLYAYGTARDSDLHRLLDSIDRLHGLSKADAVPTREMCMQNYVPKLTRRLLNNAQLFAAAGVDVDDVILQASAFFAEFQPRIVAFIHGDPWFSNVMIRDDRLVLLDGRGALGSTRTTGGDVHYDYAKIMQSILGLDFAIERGRFYGREDESRRASAWMEFLRERLTRKSISFAHVRIIAMFLILGSLPFHVRELAPMSKHAPYLRRLWDETKSLIASQQLENSGVAALDDVPVS